MRHSLKTTLNFDDPATKRKFISSAGALTGLYNAELSPTRELRSQRQNRWYWSCLVSAFAEYMNEQDYDITTVEQAHEMLKARFLATTVVNKSTGEILGRRVKSTAELTTAEFSDYCDRARAWMADFFGIVVPDPATNEGLSRGNVSPCLNA